MPEQTGLPETLLIYASASMPAEQHVVRKDGTIIHVRYIDLEASDCEVLAEMGRITRVVERIGAADVRRAAAIA